MARTVTVLDIGTRFGDWVVIAQARRVGYLVNPYTCKCKCGRLTDIDANRLLKGLSKSCRPCSSSRSAKASKGTSKPSQRKMCKWDNFTYNVSGEFRMKALLTNNWKRR